MTTKRKRVFDEGLSRQKRALRIPTTGAGHDHRDKVKYTRKKKHRDKMATNGYDIFPGIAYTNGENNA